MPQTREDIWADRDVYYWTNDRIQEGLGINRKIYREIYAALERELNEDRHLGGKINSIMVYEDMRPAFAKTQM